MARTMLLDLDGTLVDSVPDLAAALNRAMARHGLAPFAPAEVTRMVGDGARVLVERAFAARGRTAGQAELDLFIAEYEPHAADATQPYPGVRDGLAALRESGWRLAVCTNKPQRATGLLLEALGLHGMFAAIGAGDSFAVRKPDPGHLLATLHAAGGVAEAAVMVGDHHNDVLAARGAGMPCIFAAWGYGGAQAGADAAAVAASFAAVPALAAGLIAQA